MVKEKMCAKNKYFLEGIKVALIFAIPNQKRKGKIP
jgi:hypothetical protein